MAFFKGRGRGGKGGRGRGGGRGGQAGTQPQGKRELEQVLNKVLREGGQEVSPKGRGKGRSQGPGGAAPKPSRRATRKAARQEKRAQRTYFFGKGRNKGGAQEEEEEHATPGEKGARKREASAKASPAPKKQRRGRRKADEDDEEITSDEEEGQQGAQSRATSSRVQAAAELTDDEGEEEEAVSAEGEEGEESGADLDEEPAGGPEVRTRGAGAAASGSYVPPHLRNAASRPTASAVDQTAQRQLRSIMNRVTEGNLDPSARELSGVLDKLVPEAGSAAAAAAMLRVLLPAAVGDPNISVLVLGCHAALATGAHLLFGPAFGAAALLQAGDWLRDRLAKAEEEDEAAGEDARVARSCITFLALLFSFGLLPGSVIFDLVRFVFAQGRVSEVRIELALTILRYAGRTLRGECPEDFKETLAFVGSAAGGAQGKTEGAEIRTRLDYLLRELQDLKNNKVSFAVMDRFDAIRSWVKSAPMLGGRKVLDHQLAVPFRFLAEAQPAGWPLSSASAASLSSAKRGTGILPASKGDPLRAQAVAQRLSTELRQSLFVALMGAEDFEHACQRLSAVAAGAKAGTEEACLVLLHCAVRERVPNPFYEHVASALCGRPAPWGKRFSHCLKRAVVQHLQQAHGYGVRAVVNLADLCAALVVDSGAELPLSVVRFVRFGEAAAAAGASGKALLGGVLGLLLRHLVESLLRRLADAEAATETFQQLQKYEDVREGMLLVLDKHVQPRLPTRAEAPLQWAKLRAARRVLSAQTGE